MKESLRTKLMELVERHEEVARLLGDTATIADKNRFRELSKEYARLDEVAHDFNLYLELERNLVAAAELRSSAEILSRAADRLQDPRAVIFGPSAAQLGPGERMR